MGSHRGLQHLDAVSLQELVNGVGGILQVRELPRSSRTVFTARSSQSFGDPVIAQAALFRGIGLWINETAAIGAGLHTVAAAEAVLFVDQDHAIRTDEGRADRANLRTG